MTPDSETSELHERALDLVRDGSSPDEVCARLPVTGEESDAALWLYSWALAQQQRDERPLPRAALPSVSS